jgi:CO/xanthine dehydrogenase Mo-binding subunit
VVDRDDRPDRVQDSSIEAERYELFAGPAYRFEVQRRDFFKVLGAGLVVAFALPSATAQESGGARRGDAMPADVSAWLHIGEDGRVSVFTGKAEVGQNIRTSLSQVVAEELRVPIDSITMVMADTAVTPFDMGTFGSRTTPFMAPQLRKVAAAAREMLVDLAAQRWSVDRGALVAQAGAVTHPPTRRQAGYGELTKGQKLAKTIGDDTPRPRICAFQAMFFASLHSVGSLLSPASPAPVGPRQPGQSSATAPSHGSTAATDTKSKRERMSELLKNGGCSWQSIWPLMN